MKTKSQLLYESNAQMSRLHALFMSTEAYQFDSIENSERFSRILRVQDLAFIRNRRRYQSWFAELQNQNYQLLREESDVTTQERKNVKT